MSDDTAPLEPAGQDRPASDPKPKRARRAKEPTSPTSANPSADSPPALQNGNGKGQAPAGPVALVRGAGVPEAKRRPGRPTLYDPSFCARVIEVGARGYSKTMIAADLDVHKETLDNWSGEHPEFSEAMSRAREAAQAWWEAQGVAGIWSRDFNAQAYRLQMLNRFPDDWRDTVSVDDGRLKVDWHKLAAQPGGQALIKRIADGEDFRAVLAGVLDQLRQEGVIEYREPKRLGPGSKNEPPK